MDAVKPVRFAGYAARFDLPDRGGDVVRPGAFTATLAAARAVPLLWQHDPARPCGVIERLEEDARGLRVVGRANGEAAEALATRRVTGLSFGYRIRSAHGQGPRELRALDLVEISLVDRPMQPKARVIATG